MMVKREIDALVAEAMGLDVYKGYVFVVGPISCPDNIPGCLVAHSGPVAHALPYYSADAAASCRMEDWIEDQGDKLKYAYAFALADVLGLTPDFYGNALGHIIWTISHATPEQRCLAFLKAMGVEVDNANPS